MSTQKLKDYVNGKIHYTALMNFMNQKLDLFDIIGEYAYNKDNNIFKKFGLSDDFFKSDSLITKMDIFNKKKRQYNFLGILLLTDNNFASEKLKEIYSEPIFHNEFGEGFEGEYNEETDEYDDPDIKESFASYFITIKNVDFHIGYDHRGLSIEVKKGTDINDLIESLKEFVDIIYLK